VSDDDLAKVAGRWMTPPEAQRLLADADKILTF
jgi:hypothetical protein